MQLLMRRPDLKDLPEMPPLPPGCVLRPYRQSNGLALAKLLHAAFPQEGWTEESVRAKLIDDQTVQTIFVIERESRIVATASSRLAPESFPGSGYVHWVGADPQMRGLKLGTIVTLTTLHDFVRLGCQDAVLETDDLRLPAIVVYRRLGFEPVFRDDTHRERWQRVETALAAKSQD